MEKKTKAVANGQRITARKARLVIDQVRGKKVADAINILGVVDKKSSGIVLKLVNSAVANAVNNFDMDVERLYISEAFVNEGSTLKRFRPRAQGRSSQILKRTSHIHVIVSEAALKHGEVAKVKEAAPKAKKADKPKEKTTKAPTVKPEFVDKKATNKSSASTMKKTSTTRKV